MFDIDIDDIDKLVIYINAELLNGRSMKDIEINDFEVNERVLAKRLARRGYKRVENELNVSDEKGKLIKIFSDAGSFKEDKDKQYDNVITPMISTKKNEYDKSNTEVIAKENTNSQEYDESNTIVITDTKFKNNLINLAKNYDKIMNIIEEYDKKYDARYDKEYEGITIELPIETKNDFRATIRINNVIWDQFGEFANNHKEFTKRDLLSMALKEYIDKYK